MACRPARRPPRWPSCWRPNGNAASRRHEHGTTHRRSRRRISVPHRDRSRRRWRWRRAGPATCADGMCCWSATPTWRRFMQHGARSAARSAPGPAGRHLRAACRRSIQDPVQFRRRHRSIGHAGRNPRRLHFRAGRRRGWRPGRLRRGLLDARRGLRAAAHHPAVHGGFLGRRQDRRGHRPGQEPGRRLPSTARGVRRHLHAAHPAGARTACGPGGSHQVRRDPRSVVPRLAGIRTRTRCWPATTPRWPLRSPAVASTRPRSWNATRWSAASARCSTWATPSAMPSKPNRAMAIRTTPTSTTAKRWPSGMVLAARLSTRPRHGQPRRWRPPCMPA